MVMPGWGVHSPCSKSETEKWTRTLKGQGLTKDLVHAEVTEGPGRSLRG